MSVKSFRKKLEKLRGEYLFDFSKEDDRAYFLEEYGGEERLKKTYPALYESFCRAGTDCLKKAEQRKDTCIGILDELQIEKMQGGRKTDGGSYAVLKAPVAFSFIDETKEVVSDEAASEWVGISIQARIKEKNSQNDLVRFSKVVRSANSYCGVITSDPELYGELMNKAYLTSVEVTGRDPAGNLQKKIFQTETTLGEVEENNIVNISVSDPAPKTEPHIVSDTIMMLYGRINQQEIFQYADYKDGDYYNNVFQNGKVRLLIPITGEVTYNYGVEPVGLYYSEDEKFTRSEASYDYKDQKFTYRGDTLDPGCLTDRELYDKLKSQFTAGKYVPELQSKMKFDISIEEEGRSRLDWHTDVEGAANGEPKTIMLTAKFSYQIKDPLQSEVVDMIRIQSVTKDDLSVIGREYYKFKAGSNTIYIPPITVYWGCLGKDTKIMLAGGCEKRAEEIRTGDQVCGQDGRVLRVKDIITGKDYTIFRIRTDNGASIMASGGHPLMCGGSSRRVSSLRAGDALDLVLGGQSEIEEIEEVVYDDAVYNFVFEEADEGVYLAADGFWAGDLNMQNTKMGKKKKELSEKDLAFIGEMERWLEEG